MKRKSVNTPPAWITSFFEWCCRPAPIDDLLGDMHEFYISNLKNQTKWKADTIYFMQCLQLVFSYTVKKRKKDVTDRSDKRLTQNVFTMYRSYLKMAFRSLRKQLKLSIINVFGLGVGLAACFLIMLFLQSELSYDQFHEDKDRIYRLTKTYPAGNEEVHTAEFRYYLTPYLKELIPAVESYSRIKNIKEGFTVKGRENEFEEEGIAFVDANFFDFFSFNLLSGDKKEVLEEPYTMVISEHMSKKYFGKSSPIGQVLSVRNISNNYVFDVKVTGVFEDMPDNSHFHKSLLISMKTGEVEDETRGLRSFVMQHNYIKLFPEHSIAEVEELLPGIEEKYAPSFFKRLGMHLRTQPLLDIHLESNLEAEFGQNGNIDYVYILSVLGVFIILIAAFNYMNLTTANALNKAKEVGIRKILGSGKKQLITRFIIESLTTSFLALIFAVAVAFTCLPFFNLLTGRVLTFSFTDHLIPVAGILIVMIIVGILSGFYPALYLSSFQVVKSLKGSISKQGKGTRFVRKGLVVVQFVISIALMVSAVVVFNQLDFLKSRGLGFNTEAILNVRIKNTDMKSRFGLIKEELLKSPNVLAVTGSSQTPITDFGLSATNGIVLEAKEDEIPMNYLRVDDEFFDLYNIPLVAGRAFKNDVFDRENGLIINESAVQRMGFELNEVLGKKVYVYDGYEPEIIGVVKDFHFETLHNQIGPVYFQLVDGGRGYLSSVSIKVRSEGLSESVKTVYETFEELGSSGEYELTFLSDKALRAYQSEKYFMRTFTAFTIIAIAMACLGAIGLVTQVVSAKRKEIGVRKILGASVGTITFILTKEMLLLVLLSNLVAWPIAFYGMNSWLESFAYHDVIGFGVFFLVLVLSCAITLLSIGGASLKAALTNPVESLKVE